MQNTQLLHPTLRVKLESPFQNKKLHIMDPLWLHLFVPIIVVCLLLSSNCHISEPKYALSPKYNFTAKKPTIMATIEQLSFFF